MRNSLIKSISLVTLLLTMGVGQLWADVWIRGDMNSWSNNDDWKFSDGKLEVYLDANTDYTFKVWDEVGYQNNHYRSYDLQSGKITSTIVKYNLDKDNVDGYNLVLHTAEAGTYIFQYAYEDSKHKLSIYFPRARLEKQKYVYFDARRLTGSNSDYWQRDDFTARFWFKYYDSGSDNGSVDCSKANALEDWVYYALVPDHAYIGQIQLNRIVNNSATCAANIAHAKDRDGTAQNCLKEETGKVDYCNSWTPQWTTYCPIKATSTISDNGTIKTWGGSGTSGSPYYVATGSKIKVSGTSTDNISDANMTTKYDFQVRNTSDVQQAHSDGTGTTYEYTVPATNDVVYKVRVNSYNYYNSTSSTAKWSSDIYYKARTPYTISYNAGTGGSGSRASETKLKGVSFTLPNSAVFERTGYTQTGWTTSDGGSQTHALGGSYTGDSTQTFYPFWTENEYNITIAVSGPGTTSPASSVVGKIETPSVEITATPNTGYKLRDWGFSKTGEDNDVWCADSYSSTDATIKILAKHDGTLTANFIAQTYRVGLDNRAATTPGTGSVNVTYNSTDGLTSAITCPQKTYYTFGGYYISTDGGRTLTNTQLIAANGNWNTNVSGYIDENKKWICAGDTMLYAKWTETLHTITIQSGGNGTVSPASVNVGGVTSSEAITATPNTGYHFRDWTLPAGGIVTTHEKTSSTDATIHIKATGSGSITANFDPTNYTVTLEDKGADEGHKGTSNVSVTYNATTGLTSAITCPEKSHYSFGGYYTSNDGGVTLTNTQLIDANGNWVKNVSGYTGSSGNNPTWIHAGNITLYAKWTETLFTVNVAVSPAEAGSVKVNGSTVSQVTAGFATHSPQLIADSVNALWTFKVWQATSNAHLQTGSYGIYRPTMEITAEAANQTVTAVFQHRYNLLGSKYAINTEKQNQELGGMPGWNYGNGADFTVNSYPGDGDDVTVELVCTRNLVAGTYIFEIHDRATSKSLGRKNGSSIYELGEGQSVELRDGDDQNQSIFFYPQAAGEYTFKITFMRKSGVNYYPTVTILRPQQVHLGWKYENIGGSLSDGNTGGTAEIKKKSDNSDVPNGTWLTYGTAVTYNANPVKGYKVDWYANNDYSTDHITSSYSFDHDGTSTGNGYVKFTELATKVSLENDGHGHVEIGDVTQTETTCGVTTTRSLTAVPNTGYTFHEWSKPSGDDIDFTTNINPTTLRGNGDGLQKGQRVCANFTAKTYTVTLDNDHGNAENNGSATATYASSTLTDKTDATFDGWTVLGYWNNTAVQVINSDGTLIAGVSGYTDGSSNWIYDNNVSLYAHWSRSITLDKNGGTADGSVTMTYKGTAGTPSAPTRANYHVVGYYTEAGCTNKVMEANGTLVNYAGFVEDGKWVHQTASTLYAKWEGDSYTVTLNNDHGGESSDNGAATVTYNATSLTVSKHASFEGWNLLGYWNSSAVQVANADGSLIAGVTNFTDASAHWTKTDNADLWAHWSRTITLDKNGGKTDGSVTVTYKGTATTPTAPVYSGYTLEGYYAESGCTTKVMNTDGTLVNYAGFVEDGKWVHQTASTLYAKWTSPNFVIYRSGDKASDPHALSDAVETYDGGTLDKPIEFRMKVHQLDWWYTLCLPFTVTAVQVWDDEDGAYYDLEPYYRDDSGYHGGYYIIRTPSSTTNFPIANFDDWRDPTYATGWLPSRNTPYIIQWHNSYFSGKYISFFGLTGQTIPSFSAGEAPLSNDVVNVHGNNSMTSGSVTGAYLLEADYGPNGAWLRAENPSASRTILPFECYILVNEPTRTKYRAIRPGMSTGDTPTGSLPVTDNSSAVPRKVLINNQIYIIREGWMYTIQGSLVKEAE